MNNRKLALNLFAIVVGMLMLAYASVPLYRIFCAVTGFGGTTREADHAPGAVGRREVTVRFNADHAPGLSWRFVPLQREVTLRVGEEKLVFYQAENLTDRPVTGRATYNVVPFKSGPYFVKIACFCFEEQTLAPRQKVDMPISFFLDPELLNDSEMNDVHTITLSYTFFPVENPTLPASLRLNTRPEPKD